MAQETRLAPSLEHLSAELAQVVERATAFVVRVDDGSRLTATGIVWSQDGIVVTTSHGVERDEEIAVERADGSVLPATLLGRDGDSDIAILKVEATDLTPAPRTSDDEARVGNLVLALGRPGRAGLRATLGIISACRETQSQGRAEYILETDADLYPGFSGGPLIGMNGSVVGVLNLMFGRGRGVALGAPFVNNVVTALLEHGQVRRGYLGVRMQQVSLPETTRQSQGIEQARAVLLIQVEAGSPAEQAGLLLGDTVLGVNGQPIEDVDGLRRHLRTVGAGETVTLDLVRGGTRTVASVTLGVEPSE